LTDAEKIADLEARLTKARTLFKQQRAEIADLKKQLLAKSTKPIPVDMAGKILAAYPKTGNGASSTAMIEREIRNIVESGGTAEYLLERTNDYAACLKRFQIDNKHELWKLVPSAAKWFSDERYNHEPADWSAAFREGRYIEETVDEPTPEQLVWPDKIKAAVKKVFPLSNPDNMTFHYFKSNHPDELAMAKTWVMKNEEGKYERMVK
jgi:hypothetical protein